MPSAPLPPDEDERLAALRSFEVLDTEPDAAFDDLTRIAARVCGAPVALVSLVDSDRQWFKARCGSDASEMPRDVSVCAYAIQQSRTLVVPDLREDPRFADNPVVTGPPHVRFYAGAPLKVGAGSAIGTLCVLDFRPRELTAVQVEVLEALASQVVHQLELVRSTRRLAAATRRAMALERILVTYTPRSVWGHLGVSDPEAASGALGVRVERAYLFTEICRFAQLSAGRSPEQVNGWLNRYLGEATDAIHEHGGDVEKFVGYGIFAVFESADAALIAAAQVHQQAAAAAREDREAGRPPLCLCTGVHWGVALRTHVGNDQRRDYTLIGEAVNVAARLQQAAGRGELLVSREILERASGQVSVVERRSLRLRGISEPVLAHVLDVAAR